MPRKRFRKEVNMAGFRNNSFTSLKTMQKNAAACMCHSRRLHFFAVYESAF